MADNMGMAGLLVTFGVAGEADQTRVSSPGGTPRPFLAGCWCPIAAKLAAAHS